MAGVADSLNGTGKALIRGSDEDYQMSERLKLKGCPFCGAPPDAIFVTEVESMNGDIAEAFANCDLCEAQGPQMRNVRDAAEGWNKAIRMSAPQVREFGPIRED